MSQIYETRYKTASAYEANRSRHVGSLDYDVTMGLSLLSARSDWNEFNKVAISLHVRVD